MTPGIPTMAEVHDGYYDLDEDDRFTEDWAPWSEVDEDRSWLAEDDKACRREDR